MMDGGSAMCVYRGTFHYVGRLSFVIQSDDCLGGAVVPGPTLATAAVGVPGQAKHL